MDNNALKIILGGIPNKNKQKLRDPCPSRHSSLFLSQIRSARSNRFVEPRSTLRSRTRLLPIA